MTQTKKTKVLFVQEVMPDGVLAVFPDIPQGKDDVQCYVHNGQHSYCGKKYYKKLQEATPSAYKPLYDELVKEYGYDLEILNKPQNDDPQRIAVKAYELKLLTDNEAEFIESVKDMDKERLSALRFGQYKWLKDIGDKYAEEIKQAQNDDPIKCAFTSPTREGRTIIIYKDGGVKLIDQGSDWDTTAQVQYWGFEDRDHWLDKLADVDPDEVKVIREAIQAP